MTQFSITPPAIDAESKSGTQLAADLSSLNTALNSTHEGATAPTYAGSGLVWSSKTGDQVNVKDSVGSYILGHRPITSIADLRSFGAGLKEKDVVRIQVSGEIFDYYWDSTSEESDNGITIILPADWTEPGRWRRLIGSAGVSWWTTEEAAVIYDGSTEYFIVSGDETNTYVKDRALTLTQTTDALVYVVSSTLDSAGDTVVQVVGGDVDSGLSVVEYGQLPGSEPSREINLLPEKETLVDDDLVGGENSASSFARIKIKCLAIYNYIIAKLTAAGMLPKTQLTTNTTFTVGTGGDYNDLATACYDIYNKYYPKAVLGGITVEIKCLSGYVMSNPLHIVNGIDMGFMTITSVDTAVKINPTGYTSTQIQDPLAPSLYTWIYGDLNSTLPNIKVLFDIENKKTSDSKNVTGIRVLRGSRLQVINRTTDRTSGCVNCSGAALGVCGRVDAGNTIWSSTTIYGIVAFWGGIVHAEKSSSTHGGSSFGYWVTEGGLIYIKSGTGFSGTVSQTVNTITGNGIIFQS